MLLRLPFDSAALAGRPLPSARPPLWRTAGSRHPRHRSQVLRLVSLLLVGGVSAGKYSTIGLHQTTRLDACSKIDGDNDHKDLR